MDEKFLKGLVSDTKEFTMNNGMVTCEFSIQESQLDDLFMELDKPQYRSPLGRWFATTCKTCVENHGEGTVHVSLEPEQWLPLDAGNLLKIQSEI